MKSGDEAMRRRAEALTEFYRTQKRLPSFAEMAALFGVRSKNAVAKIVAKFVAAGVLSRDATGHLIPGSLTSSLRLLGTVEAGFPSPAEEETFNVLSLDDLLVGKSTATFMLTVSGDSMIEAGIMPGDLVIVDRGLKPKPGDIVIAVVDGHWTMKYFCREKGRVVLRPANSKYPEIRPQRELVIHGVVRSSVRKYR